MSEYVRHEEKAGALRLRIIADPNPPDPRREWDHPGTILCCDHRRYVLGDEDAHGKAADLIRVSRDYRSAWEAEDGTALDFSFSPHLWRAVQRCRDIVSLPCFLYDHSGITMSTGAFSCPWDSGQVGFICIGKADILALYQKTNSARLTASLRDRALSLLTGEMAEYDMYLTGDVWGCVVDRVDGSDLPDGDTRSSWGMFGAEYAEEEGQRILAAAVTAFPDLAVEPSEDA